MALKRLIIMRGIPGAGKTHYHETHYPGAVVGSADYLFQQSGAYVHNPAQLDDAHQACFRTVLEAVLREEPLIVVDNTHIRLVEIAPYHMLGAARGYTVEIITIHCDPQVALQRQVHKVPEEKVRSMAYRLDKDGMYMPRWWKHLIVELTPEATC